MTDQQKENFYLIKTLARYDFYVMCAIVSCATYGNNTANMSNFLTGAFIFTVFIMCELGVAYIDQYIKAFWRQNK